MFNWPLELRRQKDFISPTGPNFNSAPWKTLKISGTQIKIKIPRLRTALSIDSRDTNQPCNLNQLADKLTERNGIRLRIFPLIYRAWDFYGPWFTGKLGRMHMQAMIVSPADIRDGLNYYNPRALEAGIADYLAFLHGNDFWSNDNQVWLAPLNWQQRDDISCITARFDANTTEIMSTGPECYLILPISKHHLLIIDSNIHRNNVFSDRKPEPTINEWIDLAPFLELANQVLDSVQVKLSPQAQADQEEALRELEDKSLAKEFPPIKWTKQPKQ